jgi:type VI secretion system protein ImpJ
MIEAREIPEAVQWTEGMLLAPQHFQLTGRRLEALLAYHLGHLLPFRWGVRRVAFSGALLRQGRVQVLDLEAVMPDGLVVVHPLEGALPLEIDLKDEREALRKASVTVHLIVMADRAGMRMAGDKGEGRFTVLVGKPVPDENPEGGAVEIDRLRVALGLLTTASPDLPPHPKYVSLPLCRVGFRDEVFTTEPHAPPLLAVTAESAVYETVDRIAVQLRDKAAALADRLQGPGLGGGEVVAGEAGASLRALVATLPRLEAMLQAQVSHPFDLYLALADTVGSLAGIAGQPVPDALPAYDHRDPLPVFAAIEKVIGFMVGRLKEPYDAIRFTQAAPHRFTLRLEPGWLGDRLYVGLRAAPGQAPAQLVDWAKSALIGIESRMRAIREARYTGASRTRIDQAREIDLIPPRNVVLYAVPLSSDGDLRGLEAVAGEVLEIQGATDKDDPNRPSEILLYVPGRGAVGS